MNSEFIRKFLENGVKGEKPEDWEIRRGVLEEVENLPFFDSRGGYCHPNAEVNPRARLQGNVIIGKEAEISAKADIRGKVFIDQGTSIKPFSYLEGPIYIGKDCYVGPHNAVRNSFIGPQSEIRGQSEVIDTVTGKGSQIGAFSVIARSILGNYVDLSEFVLTSTSKVTLDPVVVDPEISPEYLTREETEEREIDKRGAIIPNGTRVGSFNYIFYDTAVDQGWYGHGPGSIEG